jgi:GNAT superfamily N-acetyltransferase
MASSEELRFRVAGPDDAQSVAELHADSWRRHYRGAYSDVFLDGDLLADRVAVWTDRLREADPRRCTILATGGSGLVGFANAWLDDDPTWGALLDNLHVTSGRKRQGVGAQLLAVTARAVTGQRPRSGLYLWVLEQNVDAQAFYEARGGTNVGRRLIDPPGGVASRLNGSPTALRYAWPEPAAILR